MARSIERADLSGADLSNALMNLVRGNSSRLVAADLRRADLRLSDFAKADLSRADLRGANLTGHFGLRSQSATREAGWRNAARGHVPDRMRYLPVYEPPKGLRHEPNASLPALAHRIRRNGAHAMTAKNWRS